MTSANYIIDTSSLIELHKPNPLDVYPGVWDKLEVLIRSNRLFSPKEVLNEISRIDDLLYDWAKKQDPMFEEPDQIQLDIVKEILDKYPSIISLDRMYDADPWVIALALSKQTKYSKQKTLVDIKQIVVTEEKMRGNRIRIPFICREFSLKVIDIIGMFREEGWRF